MFAFDSNAQVFENDIFFNSIKEGFVLLQHNYQVLNEDYEPIGNKSGKDFYGRIFTCGIRVGSGEFLVEQDFIKPWSEDTSIPKSDKYECVSSYTGYMELSTIEIESLNTDVESANALVENHIYSISGNELEGLEIDTQFGKKRGYAVWLVSKTDFSAINAPTGLNLNITPLNITTNGSRSTYNIINQPEGHIIGGAFLVPHSEQMGQIKFRVNGIFEKIGGVWKLVSLGTEEPDDD